MTTENDNDQKTELKPTTEPVEIGYSGLLPCPFCGSPPSFKEGDFGYDAPIFYVHCSDNEDGGSPTGAGCGTLGPSAPTRDQAVSKWNHRANIQNTTRREDGTVRRKMKYEEAKQFLYSDGSWRDVYALNTELADLDRFLSFVKPLLREDSFTVDGERRELPQSYADLMADRSEHSYLLEIPVGNSVLNCRFFDDSELELDLVPKHYDNQEDWNSLDSFLKQLSNALRLDIIVTPENTPDHVHIRYTPEVEQAAAHQRESAAGASAPRR